MIDAENLPHPESLQEYVIENNAMLNKILHNQACMMEMLCQIYQFGYKSQMGRWPSASPNGRDNRGREKIADSNFETYKTVVSQIYQRFIAKVKKHHVQ